MVQAAHAAYESGIYLGQPSEDYDSIIALEIGSEKELIEVNEKINSLGIKTELFREPDIGDQATAFATEPISGEARSHFKQFKLWGGK